MALSERVAGLEREGRFAEAIEVARRAWLSGPRRVPRSVRARRLACLGRLQSEQGCDVEAIRLFNETLAHIDETSVERRAEVLQQLARAEKNRGLYADAARHYDQAVQLADAAGLAGRRVKARALMGIANLIRRTTAERPRAVELLQRAIHVQDSIGASARFDAAEARGDLALVLLQLGRVREAETQLRLAMPVRREQLGPEHPDIGLLLSLNGWTLSRQGRFREAEDQYRQAMAVYGVARARSKAGHNRRRYLPRVGVNLTSVLLAEGRGDEAWTTLEQGLSAYLCEQIEHRAAFAGEPAAHAPIPVPDGLSTLRRVQAELDPRTALVGWIEVNLVNELPVELWSFIVRDRGPVHWTRLQMLAPEHGVLTGNTRPRAVEWLLRRDLDWPARVPRSARSDAAAHAMWQERMRPLMSHLEDVDRLVVVDTGSLVTLPVELMLDDRGRGVTDRFVTSYTPSGTVFATLRARARARETLPLADMLLVGDPSNTGAAGLPGAAAVNPAGGSSARVLEWLGVPLSALAETRALPRLGWSASEIDALAALFPRAHALTGTNATEERLAELVARGRIARFGALHIAAHALRDVRLPEYGALVLGSEHGSHRRGLTANDGLLTAAEVEPWPLGADLVTLSGCSTAGIQSFGTSRGLAESFLISGASQVVVSMWAVEDQATALLMERFYANLAHQSRTPRDRGPGDVPRALQQARLWLRDLRDGNGQHPYANPTYWAGFVVMGADVGRGFAARGETRP